MLLLFSSPARLTARQCGGAAERSPSVRSEPSVSEVEDPGPARPCSPGGSRRAPSPAFTAARPTGQPQGVAPTFLIPSPLERVMQIMWNALSGPSVLALTRPSATLSQRERVRHKPLSLWERGWGEGKTAGPARNTVTCITRLEGEG